MTPSLTRTAAAVFAAATMFASPSLSHDYTLGDIDIGHPAARATPPGARTGAGYLTLTNTGAEQDRLLSVSGGIAERIEIHETTVVEGVARMRPLAEGLAIAPGATVALAPGGIHLMLIGLTAPLVEGERVPVVLGFEHAGEIEVDLAVEAMGAGDSHAGH